jgi:hypothetical protein
MFATNKARFLPFAVLISQAFVRQGERRWELLLED